MTLRRKILWFTLIASAVEFAVVGWAWAVHWDTVVLVLQAIAR